MEGKVGAIEGEIINQLREMPVIAERMETEKVLSRSLFAAYLFILLWLVLFKLSYEPLAVLRDFQTRSLNLIPFTYGRSGEMISNIVAFVPFGLLLGVNFKEIAFRNKIAAIFAFSLAVEILQYILAIGAADITDVLMNTIGGFIGLGAYVAIGRYASKEVLDRGILVVGTLVLLAVLFLRIFVMIVRY